MNDHDRLRALFEERDIILSGSLIEDVSESGTIYAFVDIKSYENTRKVPTQRKINKTSADARKLGYNVIFVLSGSDKQGESEILEILIRRKYSHWAGVAVTEGGSESEGLNVWLAASDALSNQQEKEIEESVEAFSKVLNVKLSNVTILSPGRRPTETGLALTLRTIAPCTTNELLTVLQQKYRGTDVKWLERRLDGLRKRNLVVRDSNGKYFLSLHGLDSLGTLKKRGSPDVRRALALARRPSNV